MRNLKKILALVLALVMSLSLMATAGAASFPDVADDNAYKTAIEVLNGVEVLQGYDNGARFEPKGAITRAEAAAVIYRIATGDVNDTQKDIYTAWNGAGKLSDVSGWYAGYVNYCCNAGYIKGYPNGTFQAQNNVTGYEVLAMVLRAMGYGRNGEFSGSQWAITVGSLAQTLGITKNIKETLGEPATREMVAEIVFRAIFCETQMYNALHLYEGTGTNLAANLNLEEVEGVVIANEYADLYDDDTLADGKTMVREGDKTYTINYGTNLDDLGESRMIYIQNKNTVISLADSGKNVKEETTAKEKLSAVLDRAGISQSDAESYVNFGQTLNWYSDWKISYEITIKVEEDETKAQAIEKARDTGFILPDFDEDIYGKDDAELIYREDFRKNTAIGNADQNNIEVIFDIADKKGDKYVDGEVYVGTTSKEDVSDKKSFNQFLDEYITEDDIANVSSNERGNWLKVIDNNADGQADYIFKVIYTFAQVSRIKDDTITLDVKNDNLLDEDGDACFDALNELTGEKVVPAEELVEDDVVYYAIIDGKAQTYKAATETATIDKINRNTRVVTASDGTEWTESEVCEHIEDQNYRSDISELAGKVSYDLFFDRGGYLAAFIRSDLSNNFRLILDGWYNETKSGTEYAVKAYNAETGKVDTIDITTNGGLFIDGEVENDGKKVLNNDWGALKWLGGVNENSGALDNDPAAALNGDGMTAKTTIASISEDGTILPVHSQYVTGRNYHDMIAMNDNAIPTNKTNDTFGIVYGTDVSGSRDDTAYNGQLVDDNGNPVGNIEVVARADTVYYVVEGKSVVDVFTGYRNAPTSIDHVEDVYVVGTARNADNNLGRPGYYTADIVVIEVTEYDGDYEVVFVLDDETSHNDISRRNLRIIGEDGKERNVDVWNGNYVLAVTNSNSGQKIRPGVYKMYERSEDLYYLDWMTPEERADARIIGGQVQYESGVAPSTYVAIDTIFNDGDDDIVTRKGEESYDLTSDSTLYHVRYNTGTQSGYWKTEPTVSSGNDYRDFLEGGVERVRGSENGDNDHLNRLADSDFYAGREGFYDRTSSNLNEIWAYFYNDVLIKYNKDGEVVWAISFANAYGDPERQDFAQTIWAENLCAGEAEVKYTAPKVAFFGDDVTNAVNHAANRDYGVAVAKAESGKKTIVVTPTGDNAIINVLVNNVAAAKQSDGSWVFDETVPTTQKIYNVSIIYKDAKDSTISATYTLTVNNARTTYGLAHKDDPTTPLALVSTYPGINRNMKTIEGEYTAISGSSIKKDSWKWFDVDGTDITNQSTTVADKQCAKVTVVAENGDEYVYTIMFGVEAGVAFDNKEYDVYVNSYGDVYKNVEAAYAETAADKIGNAQDAGGWKNIVAWVLNDDIDTQTNGDYTVQSEDLLWAGVAPIVEGSVTQTDGAVTPFTYNFDAIPGGTGHGYVERDGAVIVRVHYCDETIASPDEVDAAKELIAGTAAAPETWDVYYFEWHADTDGQWKNAPGTPADQINTYEAQGSAEYALEAEARAMKKPDAITVFGFPFDDNNIIMGERALVKQVNDALAAEGIDVKIAVKGRADDLVEDENNETTWGTDLGDPATGDTATYTVTFALLDSAGNNIRGGETVSITWTVHATVSWNTGTATRDDGGKVYSDPVPDDYWA